MASSVPITNRPAVSGPLGTASGARMKARGASSSQQKTVSRGETESQIDRRRQWLVGAGGLTALLMLITLIWLRLPPPQLKTDEQVFNTVDALFTALTSRDKTRLADCEQRLQAYRAEGKTSAAVADRLDAIIRQAHDGQWEPAAKQLYDFMLGQRGSRG